MGTMGFESGTRVVIKEKMGLMLTRRGKKFIVESSRKQKVFDNYNAAKYIFDTAVRERKKKYAGRT